MDSRFATLDRGYLTLALRVVAGDHLPVPILAVVEPEGEPEYPQDLTGYTFEAFVTTRADELPIARFTIDESAAAGGSLLLSLTGEQTAAFKAGTYRWRLVWTAPGDVPRTAVGGALEVSRR